MEERQAVALLKRGDISGLEHLVAKYQVRALRAAYLVCRDYALAEDIVQSAFIRAYERIETFDADLPFGPWFLRSVTNDALKAAARGERVVPFDSTHHENTGIDPGLEERLEKMEASAAISYAISQLPAEQRAAIVMRYYLELSDEEMSSRLECANSTVRWRLHSARRKLRDILPGWLKPSGAGSELGAADVAGGGSASPGTAGNAANQVVPGAVKVAAYINGGDSL